MSHLEEQLSALIDGELNGAELDRVNAHLAACEQCRAEAASLRLLKRELRHLAAARPSPELTSRLLSLAASEGLGLTPRPFSLQASLEGPHAAPRGYTDRPGTRRDDFARRSQRSRPPQSPDEAWARRRRARRLAWGAISFVMTVGIGAGAYSLGGGFSSGARVTPQMELFNVGRMIGGDLPMQPTREPSWPPSPSPSRRTRLP